MPDQDGLPEFRFHHLGLSVPDIDESAAWFAEKLGFTEKMRMDNPRIPATVAFLNRGDNWIELFQVPGAAPLPEGRSDMEADPCTHGTKHVAFQVDDIDGLMATLRDRGVDVVDVVDRPWARIGFVRDNAGNLIEFVQVRPG